MENSTEERKRIFTTGEVAKLLSVNINTIIRWFDSGRIQGYRLPTGRDRRIPMDSLKAFMVANSFPLDLLDDQAPVRRRHERLHCNELVEFTIANGSIQGPYSGILSDVSRSGARITTRDAEHLYLPIPTSSCQFQVKEGNLANSRFSSRVVHLQMGGEEVSMGLEFGPIESPSEGRLFRFLDARNG